MGEFVYVDVKEFVERLEQLHRAMKAIGAVTRLGIGLGDSLSDDSGYSRCRKAIERLSGMAVKTVDDLNQAFDEVERRDRIAACAKLPVRNLPYNDELWRAIKDAAVKSGWDTKCPGGAEQPADQHTLFRVEKPLSVIAMASAKKPAPEVLYFCGNCRAEIDYPAELRAEHAEPGPWTYTREMSH